MLSPMVTCMALWAQPLRESTVRSQDPQLILQLLHFHWHDLWLLFKTSNSTSPWYWDVRYWIANGSPTKSVLLHLFSTTPSLSQVCSLPVTSPIPLHSSLFPPCFILCPCLPVSLISIPMLPWSSCLSHTVSYPIPSSPCFMLVPLFLVPDWVKPNLQHRVSQIAVTSCTLC